MTCEELIRGWRNDRPPVKGPVSMLVGLKLAPDVGPACPGNSGLA